MKVYLASFFEEHNWGKGRAISIARGQKPRVVLVNLIYEGFCPTEKISRKYYADKQDGIESAGEDFQQAYSQKLEEFFRQAEFDATKANKSVIELLALEEGGYVSLLGTSGKIELSKRFGRTTEENWL